MRKDMMIADKAKEAELMGIKRVKKGESEKKENPEENRKGRVEMKRTNTNQAKRKKGQWVRFKMSKNEKRGYNKSEILFWSSEIKSKEKERLETLTKETKGKRLVVVGLVTVAVFLLVTCATVEKGVSVLGEKAKLSSGKKALSSTSLKPFVRVLPTLPRKKNITSDEV